MFDTKTNLKTKSEQEIHSYAQPLQNYLIVLTNDKLKEICKFYNIKGYSGRKKDELVKLIAEFIFKDFEAAEMLFEAIKVEEYNALNHLIISDSFAMEYRGAMPPHNLIFMKDGYVFIPSDVKEYLRNYVVEKSSTEEQDDEVKALVSAVNLYGYFSLPHYQQLLKKYLNIETTVQSLHQELSGIATIKDGFVLNPLMEAAKFSGRGIEAVREYYVPETWEEFQKYFAFEYYESTDEIEQLLTYLDDYIGDAARRKDIEDSLIVMMKMMDNPEHLMSIISDMMNEGVLTSVPPQPIMLHMMAAYRNIRNWHLGGHKMNEVNNAQPQPRVINKQVRKKSKKRRKNNNISRFRK